MASLNKSYKALSSANKVVNIDNARISQDLFLIINKKLSNVSVKAYEIHKRIWDKINENQNTLMADPKGISPLISEGVVLGSCRSLNEIWQEERLAGSATTFSS